MTLFVVPSLLLGGGLHLQGIVMARVLVLILPLGMTASFGPFAARARRGVAHDFTAHILAVGQDSLMLVLMDKVIRALGQTLTTLVVLLLN